MEKLVDDFYKENQKKNKSYQNKIDQKEIIKSKALKIDNLESVLNIISDEQKFIIINDDIRKLICKDLVHPKKLRIQYIINKKCLILFYGKDKGIIFKNTKNNIIGKFYDFCDINYINSLISKSYFFENVQHLIRQSYFKNELISNYNSKKIYLKEAYLINSQIINRFKELYNWRNLIDNLYKQKLLEGITYQNCDDNYSKIYEYLNKYLINYMPEKTEIDKNETKISIKTIKNQDDLFYLDSFEIIDQNYYSFLANKFFKKNSGRFVYYTNINGKLLLIIDYGRTYIYEIISFNENGDIMIEYLIECNKLSNDTSIDDNSIFQFIKNLLSGINPISVDENVSLKFHPINNNLKQNINKNEIVQDNLNNINDNQINRDDFDLQINTLKKQLKEEKDKNQKLINENKDLNAKIIKLNSDMNELKNKIQLLENDLMNKRMEIQQFQIRNNSGDEYEITSIKPGEKIMAVNFVSMGVNDIGHYNLLCKDIDLFVKLEERLYKDFPQFKEHETYFEVNANRIKRFKSLKDNNIKNNDVINMFIIDN